MKLDEFERRVEIQLSYMEEVLMSGRQPARKNELITSAANVINRMIKEVYPEPNYLISFACSVVNTTTRTAKIYKRLRRML